MEVKWYLKVGAKEVGPLSAEQLKAMAERGQISEFDPVRRGSDGPWVPAGSVKGLLASRPASTEKPQPRRMPVAKKLDDPPAAPGGFSIDASADTPAQRIAGRRIPAGADSNRRRTRTITVALVLLALGAAAVLAVMMLSGRGEQTAAEGVEPAAQEADALEPEPGSDVVIPGLAEFLGEPEPESPVEAPPADEWIDASVASADQGDVTVRVTSVQIGRPRLVNRQSGRAAHPRNDYLSVALDLHNTSQTTKLDYTSWSRQTTGVKLFDNNQNEYTMKSFAARGMDVDGQVQGGRGALGPEKAIADVLLFERPAADARFLRLELPRSAFGEKGSLRFEIPISMVVVEAKPEETAKPDVRTSVDPSMSPAEDYDGPRAIPGVSSDEPAPET
ncbi:MAG: DUF4339 domain-containing protein, partial [Planctomycetes bacterium]|nr:DUF4339 domain-containing protein [Planctomycetota bacterium]